MHSGYPMMGYIEAGLGGDSNLLDGNRLYEEGTWGAFHELGHNMQWDMYTIPSTQQTGCNFWAIIMNQALESGGTEHNTIVQADARIHDWVMRGKPWEEWGVWLALDTYRLLADIFGWETYTETFLIYYDNLESDVAELDSEAKELSFPIGSLKLTPWLNSAVGFQKD